VNLTVQPGEIHALLGENGAGKSTLVKILYGLLQPDAGEIRMDGGPVVIDGPADARARGIGMVFQHFSLFEALTVAENVALAMPPGERIGRLARRVGEVAAEYGLPLVPNAPVHALSVGERQRVEIVRCLLQNPRLVILDEPTAVLTPQEAERLFQTLDRLAAEGKSILYISHRLIEVKRLCHRATVLRGGRVVAAGVDPRRETASSLAALMVGREVRETRSDAAAKAGITRLSVRNLSLPAPSLHGVALSNIDLEVRAGEIVAIAGVAGNGQSELFEALSGERLAADEGAVVLDGMAVGHVGVTERRKCRAAFVPEERLGHAAAPTLKLSENALLTRHADAGLVRGGFLDLGRALGLSDRIAKDYDVRKGTRDPAARSLSGGNLQKFVVGRELLESPAVLVVNQPTWGVDAGAAAEIRKALIELARSGAAVLVISQDLDEILAIADRIAVIHDGKLSKPEAAATVDIEHIGLLMGGARPELHADSVENPAEALDAARA
jgi:simple sugar transport system ATP-binding protein